METTNTDRTRSMRSALIRVAVSFALVFALFAAVAPAAEAVPRDPTADMNAAISHCGGIGGQAHLNDDFVTVTCVTRDGVYHCNQNGCFLVYRYIPIFEGRL